MNTELHERPLSTADFVAVARREQPAPPGGPTPAPQAEDRHVPLFAADEGQRFRTQWTEIQTAFVDEPRRAVEQGDHLVAEVIQRIAKGFADERAKLEHEWSKGEDSVSTEDLRQALRRYRSFFDRLLSM